MELYLNHSGTPHEGATPHSGRYAWGSGENSKQRPKDLYEHIQKMHRQGVSDKEIAEGLGISLRQLQAVRSYSGSEYKLQKRTEALDLINQGYSQSEAARRIGVSESTLRGWLKKDFEKRASASQSTADLLKKEVDKYKYIDVGFGVAQNMGITESRLAAAVQSLQDQGYAVVKTEIKQVGFDNQYTPMVVLCKNGTTRGELFKHQEEIRVPNQRFVEENGRTLLGLNPIKSISSDRIAIQYGDKGGAEKDGIIELRRSTEDLSMGNSRYAQVRIGVDGTHFLKGMAIYADDLPDGVDIRFNTNKKSGTPKLDVLKPMKMDDKGNIDKDNPFGAAIKEGGQKGYLNIVREEGDWAEWTKTLSSQFLSKQSTALAKKQLDMAIAFKKDELDQIKSLTNPGLKKYFLEQFANSCDSDAEHLKAASLPRQSSRVLLPLTSIKPDQVYAPGYKNGEKVALVRYPHAGTFEIPILTVNNNNREAKRLFSQAIDAVGINHTVAERLSGADFDGDTVTVIPTNDGKIKSTRALKGLENFDPKESYPERKGMKYMSKKYTQQQMGIISNLITDMTLQGASEEHMVRAVKHSMVVIDAYKHKLDYKRSEKENDIDELKRIYPQQSDGKYGGSSTLISRAKSQEHIPERRQYSGNRGIDSVTGEKVYYETGRVGRSGKIKTMKTTKMALTSDAHSLISNNPSKMEFIYAEHANTLKAMANEARKDILATKDIPYSPSARIKYKAEVDSLKGKVTEAIKTRPYERQAQILTNHIVNLKISDNPAMTKEDIKKARTQALKEQRARLNSKAKKVEITSKEWAAIQAGAIPKSTANAVFRYADQDKLKDLAMPKNKPKMTSQRISLAKAMYAKGHTQAEIASRLGVSVSTVQEAVKS